MPYHLNAARIVDVSDELRPTLPANRRSPRELATAERMLRRLRGQIASGTPTGPTRRAVLSAAVADARDTLGDPAAAAMARAADRLLDELAGDADQPVPFDVAAGAVERATQRAADAARHR